MRIEFTKMHGLGNDFMVIDAVHQTFDINTGLIQQWSDRRTGIGFDQCLLVKPSRNERADFDYVIYNADGSEVGQCGNGARCLARFIRERGLSAAQSLQLQTANRVLSVTFADDNTVSVNMGAPLFEPAAIPLSLAKGKHYPFAYAGESLNFHALSIGNPHAVFVVDDVDTYAVASVGQALQATELFPQGVNVGFMQIIDAQHIRCRVYERGAGETQACGSGACAAMVAGRFAHDLASTVTVSLRGGDLLIQWQGGENDDIIMTGSATTVYQGWVET